MDVSDSHHMRRLPPAMARQAAQRGFNDVANMHEVHVRHIIEKEASARGASRRG